MVLFGHLDLLLVGGETARFTSSVNAR